MMQLVVYSLLVTLSWAYPGIPDFHGPIIHSAPIIPAPTYIKTYSAPIYSQPIIKAPVFAPAPVYAHAPVIKTIAPIPVVKHVVPAATSYSTVTRYISHPAPIVKTVVAPAPIVKYAIAPQPIFKSYEFAAPLPIHGYSGYHN